MTVMVGDNGIFTVWCICKGLPLDFHRQCSYSSSNKSVRLNSAFQEVQ